jgi:hypothetical protein
MYININPDKQKIEINPEIQKLLDVYRYELEMATCDTNIPTWRCVEYKLTKEGEFIASGSYHENGPIDTTGENAFEHILSFKNEVKYINQAKELFDVMDQLILLRRKHRLFKFGEKELEDKFKSLMFYNTGWTTEQNDDVRSVLDVSLMEIHKEEMAELLKEIKEKSKIIAVTKKTGEEPEERQ